MSIVKRVANRFAKTAKLEPLPPDEPFIDEILRKRTAMKSLVQQLVKDANDIAAKMGDGDLLGAQNAFARTLQIAAYIADDFSMPDVRSSLSSASDDVVFATKDLVREMQKARG